MASTTAPTVALPRTSSPLIAAQQLWQHYCGSPPLGTLVHAALALSTSPTAGIGLTVTTALPPHTTLLRLPSSCHIRPDALGALVPALPAEVSADPFFSLVLTVLYYELAGVPPSSSPWSPSSSALRLHVAAFPPAFDLPMFWSPAQLEELVGCSLTLSSTYVDTKTDYTTKLPRVLSALPPHLQSLPAPTLAQYQRAVAVALTRGFRDGRGLPCLVPLLDFCNTRVKGQESAYVAWEQDEDGGGAVLLRVGRGGVSAGDEVTIVYGEERGNGSLLERYGVVLDGNTEDSVELDVQRVAHVARGIGITMAPLHPERPTKRRRNSALGQDDGHEDEDGQGDDDDDDGIDSFVDELHEEFCSLNLHRPLPLRLLKLAAVFAGHYPPAELLQHSDRPSASLLSLPLLVRKGQPDAVEEKQEDARDWVTSAPMELQDDQEADVLQLLFLAVSERLGQWPTTLDHDERLAARLASAEAALDEDARRKRMALLLRMSEKRIVLWHIGRVRERLAELMTRTGAAQGDGDDDEAREDDGDDDGSDDREEDEDEQ